jgi:ABC-type glycerol-3-phosphate transport system substrate-binding protein
VSNVHRGGKVRNTFSRRHFLSSSAIGGGSLIALAAHPGSRLLSARGASAAQDRTELTFWTPGGSPTYCETHSQIAADYAELNTGVAVEFQCGIGENFQEQLLSSIAAGNPPDATVLWDTPVSLGVQGALRPLDDLMPTGEYTAVENWPEAVLASSQFGGQTWGLPVVAPTYGLWYNQELFEEKGIPSDRASFPKTWDELRALSKEFTRWEGDRLVSAGFVFFNAGPYTLGGTIPIWSALNGGQIYDAANQRYTIDAEPNVEMFDYFVAWLDEEYQGNAAAALRSGAWGASPSDEGQPPAFQGGTLAMTELGSFGMGDLYAYGEPTFTRWDVAPYPVGPSGEKSISGFWPSWMVIPAGSEHPEEMFAYLDYMSGVGVQKWFAAVPDLPTNRQVPDLVPEIVVEKRGEEFAKDIVSFFRGQLDVTTPMWDSPVQNFAIDQLLQAMERIFNKQAAPQEVLAETQQVCQAELERVIAGEG